MTPTDESKHRYRWPKRHEDWPACPQCRQRDAVVRDTVDGHWHCTDCDTDFVEEKADDPDCGTGLDLQGEEALNNGDQETNDADAK
jgi:ribosomal protein L37AE/L43A